MYTKKCTYPCKFTCIWSVKQSFLDFDIWPNFLLVRSNRSRVPMYDIDTIRDCKQSKIWIYKKNWTVTVLCTRMLEVWRQQMEFELQFFFQIVKADMAKNFPSHLAGGHGNSSWCRWWAFENFDRRTALRSFSKCTIFFSFLIHE